MLMNILRQLGLFLAGSLLTFSLFTIVFVMGLLQLVTNPEKVKTIVSDSGIYETVVSGIIEESQKEAAKDNKDGENTDEIPLDRPEVKQAIEKSFTPELLQTSTEDFIDGTYRWLNGEVEKPDFRIDLTTAKDNLIDNLGQYAKDRAAELPECKPDEIPGEVDVFNASCVPPGFNIDDEIAKIKSELASADKDKGFLADPVITADDLGSKDKAGNTSPGSTFTEDFASLPRAYQNLQLAPMFLGGLAVFASGIIILISKSKRKGFRRVAITLIIAGIVLLLGILAVNIGLGKVKEAAVDADTAGAFKDTMLRVIEQIGNEVKKPYLMFGVIYVGTGLVILLSMKFLFKAHGAKARAVVVPHEETKDLAIPEEAGAELPQEKPKPAEEKDDKPKEDKEAKPKS